MTKTDYWQRKICGIYLIQHKETGRAYCGQSNDCIKRWKAHTTPGKKSSGIAGAIKEQGVDKFIFCILEECSKDLLNEREKYWIAKYDCMEPKGWNRTSGGSSKTEMSVETKKKMSSAKLGKKISPEHKAKLFAARKGVPLSAEHKAKLSASLKGNTRNLGKKRGPPSEETKAKMSSANLGKKMPPFSEEHKAKLSAATKEYWANKKAQAFSEE